MTEREWDIETLKARSESFDRVVKLALEWQMRNQENPKLWELWTAINGYEWKWDSPDSDSEFR